ncbi:MAG: hypothetical protein ACI8UO_003929 [Verrucomicrobiales bacterium]|jgi:hypothetical protein
MNKFLNVSLGFLLASSCWPAFADEDRFPASEGWVSLFNGEDLSGWTMKTEVEGIWKVVDGVIDCEPKLKPGGDKSLWTEKSFGDVQIHVEWRIKELKGSYDVPVVLPDGSYKLDEDGKRVVNPEPGADSGILLRGISKAQLNIWNWPIGSGEVYGYRNKQDDAEIRKGVTPIVRADKPIGEWNSFDITIVGDRLTVKLNGKLVLDDAQLPGVPEEGPIALQHHGGYDAEKDKWNGASSLVQFRNIYAKPID